MEKSSRYYAVQQADGQAVIYIFGDIVPIAILDGDVSASSMIRQIEDIDASEIHVHIDSYGGSVSEAWAIYNALLQHPAKIITYGDGFVASAALYPFLAGDERIASSLSAYFLHPVWLGAEGYAEDLRAAAEEADIMTDIGINAFVDRAGMSAETVRALMEEETWLTPAQALEYGLATSIVQDAAIPVAQAAKKAIMQKVLALPKAEPRAETPVPNNPILKLFERSI